MGRILALPGVAEGADAGLNMGEVLCEKMEDCVSDSDSSSTRRRLTPRVRPPRGRSDRKVGERPSSVWRPLFSMCWSSAAASPAVASLSMPPAEDSPWPLSRGATSPLGRQVAQAS